MCFWPLKMVRKFNFFVEKGIFCIFTNLKNALPDICLGIFLFPNIIGCEGFTRNKKTRQNYVPKYTFWTPEKRSGKSFSVKMAYFGHFRASQKYTSLWCLFFPYKIGNESTQNYDFLTTENGPKTHFSSQNGVFFGILTHLKNSLSDILWWNFLLPVQIEGKDYGM